MIRATLIVSLLVALLSGCHSSSSPSRSPVFLASGYLTEKGAIRLWRQDSHGQPRRLFTSYTPFTGAYTETSDYQWQNGNLIAIERIRQSTENLSFSTDVRFDSAGQVIFMQHQQAGRRERLMPEAIARFQFDASRLRDTSDDLRRGNVLLLQGNWLPNQEVITCQGERLRPDLDPMARRLIQTHHQNSSAPVFIAWLTGPAQGSQLLLVSAENLCKSEPDRETF